jgi:2-C-methyl-D-erythritol 4-phosphate cytidylyltransferase
MQTWAIVVAAGGGTRFGGAKQFAPLGATTIVDRSVATARSACDDVVVVVPAACDWRPPEGIRTTEGGATRSASVRAGLACVPPEVDVVVVHDAARPLATATLYERVIEAVRDGADAAVPALSIPDTVKRVRDGVVIETVPRGDLVAVQTPQAFRRDVLERAHAGAGDDTDDAALVEAGGGKVVAVEGDARNFKVTVPGDLELARALLQEGERT